MINLKLSIWKFHLELDLDLIWDKWYKPIKINGNRYYSTGEIYISLFWLFYLGVGFPMPKKKDDLKKYLPHQW